MTNQSWTVGIICFNEKGTIQQVYDETIKLLHDFETDFEIILVDDASSDGSAEIIEEIGRTNPNTKSILHPENLGIGGSIRDVYFNGEKENIVFIPGDGQFDSSELIPYKNFDEDEYICFYRVENETYSFFRNSLSFLNKAFNKALLGLALKDVNWVKAYKRELITSLDLKMKSSIIESEICAKLNKLNCKPIEIKSTYQPRKYGESKGASLRNMLRVGKELLILTGVIMMFNPVKNKKEAL